MCFMRLGGDMFFGTQTGQIMLADRTGYDNGVPYVATLVGGWEMFSSPSQTITWRQARASFSARAGEPFQPQLSATIDYVITVPPPPNAGPDPGLLDLWDEGLWDAALWDATAPTPTVRNTMWVSIGMTGYSHAPVVQVTVAQNARPIVDLICNRRDVRARRRQRIGAQVMTDVNGIPNYGFQGGQTGVLGGNPATGQHAMSADEINRSIWGSYSPGVAQAVINNLYGSQGFGGQTAAYAATGAAYGRQVAPSSSAAVAAAHGGTPGYSGGGIGSDAYRGGQEGNYQIDPFTGAIVGYNAPMSYGWDANEGAPAQAAPQVYNRGEFNPQTYGWDHNEGAAVSSPSFGMNLYGANSGSLGAMSPFGSYQPSGGRGAQNWGDIWRRTVPQVPSFPSSVNVPQQQSSYQTDPFSGAIMGTGGDYDMSAQSRAYQSPLQGFDWAQSYGTRGGANANMLRAAGGASSGYYNPQLDQLSRSTLGMNNQPVDYSHMFGAPNSGYLGSQGRLNQDPFGGYVNPRDLDAGGSFPGDYAPRFNAYGNAFNQ